MDLSMIYLFMIDIAGKKDIGQNHETKCVELRTIFIMASFHMAVNHGGGKSTAPAWAAWGLFLDTNSKIPSKHKCL